MEGFLKRVSLMQMELKAPKGQLNKFGGYKYRSCEDILEAAKPLLNKYGLVLTVSDQMEQIGERYYICATATLRDTESDANISNSAFAREAESKKGMDESQITGTASSYARKYALNGLFCIDDTKDADTDAYTQTQQKAEAQREIKCERCGNLVYPVKKRDGSIWAASDMETYSKLKFGACLCGDCMKAAQKEQANATG
jgi:ribosomal protein L34E